MLTPWNIHCEGESLRGVVKHSWLENQIGNTTPDDAIAACLLPSGWSALESVFPVRQRQADQLARDLTDLFSPALLIDRCVAFAGLDDTVKERLRRAVHVAYLQSSGIESLRQPLEASVARLDQAIGAFRAACSRFSAADGHAEACELWREVLAAATDLRELLEQLPKGVVLP